MAIPIFERWGLNPREQRVATVAVFVLGAFILLAIPAGLGSLVMSRKSENDEMRAALSSVQAARAQVRERQARKESIVSRYAKRAPALAGFMEQSARAQKLEVSDSVDRPEVPHGKKYTERSTVIHLKKAGMLGIARFLESIEKSGMSVAVTRLNIRRRSGEPDSYDVEVGVSAFDRLDTSAPSEADKDKDKDKKP